MKVSNEQGGVMCPKVFFVKVHLADRAASTDGYPWRTHIGSIMVSNYAV